MVLFLVFFRRIKNQLKRIDAPTLSGIEWDEVTTALISQLGLSDRDTKECNRVVFFKTITKTFWRSTSVCVGKDFWGELSCCVSMSF